MGRKKKEWLTSIDGRERPEHNAANGQVVSQQDSFTVGGERLMYPGDPSGSPWNTINCRCTTIPVLEEMGVPEEIPTAAPEAMPDVWADPMGHRQGIEEWNEWGEREWSAWGQGLSNEEKRALYDYGAHGFANINRYLRGATLNPRAPLATEAEIRQALAGLDSAITKGTLSDDMVLWRGFSLGDVKAEDLLGQVIQDDAYVSTSVREGKALEYAWRDEREGKNAMMAEIRAPAGTNVAYSDYVMQEAAGQVGQFAPHDHELILERGTRFRILEIKHYASEPFTPRKMPYLVLEILP